MGIGGVIFQIFFTTSNFCGALGADKSLGGIIFLMYLTYFLRSHRCDGGIRNQLFVEFRRRGGGFFQFFFIYFCTFLPFFEKVPNGCYSLFSNFEPCTRAFQRAIIFVPEISGSASRAGNIRYVSYLLLQSAKNERGGAVGGPLHCLGGQF